VKFFVGSGRTVSASEVTLFLHYIHAKETRLIWHQVKELFQKSTGKILSKWKIILQLIHDVQMKKVSLENVVANPLFVN